jgi:hypothetical protein
MAEWMKAAVLKTASPKGDGGSNPSPSAKVKNPGPEDPVLIRPLKGLLNSNTL